MANYTTLRKGSSDSNAVRDLQEKLTNAGYGSYLGSTGVDGIFGGGTDSGVRAFQRANGLVEDGVVGAKTWAALNSTAQPAQTVPEVAAPEPEKSYRYDYEKDPAYQNAQQKVTELEGSRPAIQGTYDQQVEQLFQELMGQKDFKYDLNGDPLWQQYKDQYTTQGKMAMMDTMGQAAALTGGYGSSYAQGAGQQAYQGYLQQLNDRIPELHQLALQKYAQEQALLKDKFAAAKGMQDDEYAKYRDEVGDYYTELGFARDDVKDVRDYEQNAWYTEQQLRRDDENTAYTKQQNARSELMSMIASTGYTPTDAELTAAGMTRGQATALAAQYDKEMAAANAKALYNEDPITGTVIEFKSMGYANYNEMANALGEIAAEQGNEALWNKLTEYVGTGYLDEVTAQNLYYTYATEEEEKGSQQTSIMSPEAWKRRTGSMTGYDIYMKQNGINLV